MSANEYVVINGKRYAAMAGVGAETSSGESAGLVVVADGAGIGVVGSIYDGDKTVASASSTREAIASGVPSVWIKNKDATNFMRFRFAGSTVTADVASGFELGPGKSDSYPIAGSHTHWAYIADTADVTAAVVWGG